MKSFEPSGVGPSRPGLLFNKQNIPLFTGVFAIALTHMIAVPEISVWSAGRAAVIAASFLGVCLLAHRRGERRHEILEEVTEPAAVRFHGVEDRLVALDEANEFFGSSLNAADMFRLVSHRVSEIFPFAASALVVPGASEDTLTFLHVDGTNSALISGFEYRAGEGLSGQAFESGEIRIDQKLRADRTSLGGHRLTGFAATVALPLVHRDEPFGVFQLFTTEPIDNGEDTIKLLEAISDHVTPIFRRSLAFERSLSNALTDPLTGLPNERAFYMVLENQLAESLRNREERPLSILTIDIRDFGAVNSMLGHPVGDRMLEFVGARIGEHLRKMDFLARTINDEFIVILPTAQERTALEIVDRIKQHFSRNEFDIADGEGVAVALNVGWATFLKDGETAEQLLRAAQQRKREAKSELPAGVLWFPKEYVN